MSLRYTTSRRPGFTVIEIIATLGLLLFGIVAALSAVTYSIRASTVAGNRLVATFLASEGLEIMHNLRDTQRITLSAMDIPAGDYEVSFDEATNEPLSRSSLAAPLEYASDSGLYGYGIGTPTPFYRTVSVADNVDHLVVTSRVSWANGEQVVELKTHLYDWRP